MLYNIPTGMKAEIQRNKPEGSNQSPDMGGGTLRQHEIRKQLVALTQGRGQESLRQRGFTVRVDPYLHNKAWADKKKAKTGDWHYRIRH